MQRSAAFPYQNSFSFLEEEHRRTSYDKKSKWDSLLFLKAGFGMLVVW